MLCWFHRMSHYPVFTDKVVNHKEKIHGGNSKYGLLLLHSMLIRCKCKNKFQKMQMQIQISCSWLFNINIRGRHLWMMFFGYTIRTQTHKHVQTAPYKSNTTGSIWLGTRQIWTLGIACMYASLSQQHHYSKCSFHYTNN